MVLSFRKNLLSIQDENELKQFFHDKTVAVFSDIFYCAGEYGHNMKELWENLKKAWKKLK